MMSQDESLPQLVLRMEQAITRLETIVHGNEALGVTGMRKEIEDNRLSMGVIEHEMSMLRQTRPNVLSWIGGYVAFTLTFWLAIKEVREMLHVDWYLAALLGPLALLLALLLFLIGFGWVRLGRGA